MTMLATLQRAEAALKADVPAADAKQILHYLRDWKRELEHHQSLQPKPELHGHGHETRYQHDVRMLLLNSFIERFAERAGGAQK